MQLTVPAIRLSPSRTLIADFSRERAAMRDMLAIG